MRGDVVDDMVAGKREKWPGYVYFTDLWGLTIDGVRRFHGAEEGRGRDSARIDTDIGRCGYDCKERLAYWPFIGYHYLPCSRIPKETRTPYSV